MNPDAPSAWTAARELLGAGRLSVIMPAYNLGPRIEPNIHVVHDTLAPHIPIEIVVVDDGSTDGTRAAIVSAASTLPHIVAVSIDQNAGKGAALRAGFEACTGSHVLLLDGDLDLPPRQVARFFQIMARDGSDAVIGSKRHPESEIDYPWQRRLASSVYYGLVRLLVGLPVTDTQVGIKLFRREVLAWTFPRMLVKRFAFDLELLAIAHEKGFAISEAPVFLQFNMRGPLGGLGCLRSATVWRVFQDSLAIFYRLRILRYYQSIEIHDPPLPPPLVSIVIAYPAPSPQLEECLAGIARQNYDNVEVILLPDESHPPLSAPGAPPRETPPSEFQVPSFKFQVSAVPTGPLRPAEKRNIGIRRAKGSIIAFLDDDAAPLEGWLTRALIYFSDPSVAAVGGPAVTPPREPLMAVLGGRVYANPLVSGDYRYRYVPTRVREIDDYPSCNLIVRKQVLDELGGFHTEYWPGEDTYLCLEIVKKLGRRIVYDPRAVVSHHRRPLFLPHLRQIGRYGLHRGYFARRYPATSLRLSYLVPSLFVTGLFVGAMLSFCCPVFRAGYIGALGFYLAVTFLSCADRKPNVWLLTWLGVMATHVVYGLRFVQGYFSPRMPNEVQAFDHASES